jgi:hypothetical protein
MFVWQPDSNGHFSEYARRRFSISGHYLRSEAVRTIGDAAAGNGAGTGGSKGRTGAKGEGNGDKGDNRGKGGKRGLAGALLILDLHRLQSCSLEPVQVSRAGLLAKAVLLRLRFKHSMGVGAVALELQPDTAEAADAWEKALMEFVHDQNRQKKEAGGGAKEDVAPKPRSTMHTIHTDVYNVSEIAIRCTH